MHFRPAISLVAFVLAGLISALRGQAAAPDTAPVSPRRVLFTEAEMARFHAIAAEQAAQRESYIRASDEDEIIELEPYVVVGDSSLVLARIRRALERGVIGQRRIFVGLEDSVHRELLFARRNQDAFFRASSPGRPDDVPSFDGIDLLRLPQKLRPENLGGLFRAPPGAAGE